MSEITTPSSGAATRRAVISRGLGAAAAGVAASAMTTRSAMADGKSNGAASFVGGGGAASGGNCFLKGTRISTAAGERRIEDLVVGDLLPTVFGGMRAVQWIGRFSRTRSDPNKPWVKSARPVRIARSALAPNVPHADLYVTQGHAVLLDGLLIPAGNLVNGTTITLDAADEHDALEFFHIKLESHDVIYAEGAPCETLLRVDETMSNFADYLRKHGEQDARDVHCAPITGHGRRSAMMTRARRLVSPFLGPQKVDIISARLGSRAAGII
ncbi:MULTISPECIES: Hint domain-containing protein [Bradyrhizobium]|uniref:Hint domain-containing protein n=1 Tax=Bradyrhizobium TaxID=374 RepID=UPI0006846F7C|nr:MULTISPECIES: Hint domain-containing protein [Bradyrhizobium]UFW46981.1 Hint domain-containing protein [Bradyrhizobium arachidis]